MNDNPRPYSVRLPDNLRSQLEDIAKNNNRSLHAEILLRLENSLSKSNQSDLISKSEIEKLVNEIIDKKLGKK